MISQNILVTALKSSKLVRHLASSSIISANTTKRILTKLRGEFYSIQQNSRSFHLSQNVGKMLVTSSMVPPPEPTSENDVRERVLKAIKTWDRFPQDRADKLTLDARLAEDLSFDSLDMVEIVMSLEDEFGIEIKLEDAETFKTPNDAANFIINFIGISDTEEL